MPRSQMGCISPAGGSKIWFKDSSEPKIFSCLPLGSGVLIVQLHDDLQFVSQGFIQVASRLPVTGVDGSARSCFAGIGRHRGLIIMVCQDSIHLGGLNLGV